MDTTTEGFFAALAHPLRLRVLLLMHAVSALCVCELTHVLWVSQPMISRHLAQLREAGVVSDRRQGLWVYYRREPQLPVWALDVLTVAEGLADQAPFADDRVALAEMSNRPGVACGG